MASTRGPPSPGSFKFPRRRARSSCRTRGFGTPEQPTSRTTSVPPSSAGVSAAAPFASWEEASKEAAAPDAPWWLSSHEFGNLHSGGQHVKSYVPRDVYQSFSPELQLLYRHVAEGEEDFLQPENQVKARMAGGPYEDELGDNSHLSLLGGGGMGAEEWRRARGRL